MKSIKIFNSKSPTAKKLDTYSANKNTASIFLSIARYVFLFSFGYILLYPLIYMIVHAFQSADDFLDPTVQWVSKTYTFDNFKLAAKTVDLYKSAFTSIFVLLLSGLVEVFSCGIAAYGLARFNFKGKKILDVILILNILVPTTVIIIPTYINFRYMDIAGILNIVGTILKKELRLNLLDTPFVFYVPSLLAVGIQSGFFIYIFKQFFKGFPKELEEAASIDGASAWKTFFKIVIPSSGVAVLTVFIFSVIWHWNEYYRPAMFYSTNYPLAVKIKDFFTLVQGLGYNVYSAEAVNAAMAASIMFILPVLIMYMIMQRKFIESISQTGIVG